MGRSTAVPLRQKAVGWFFGAGQDPEDPKLTVLELGIKRDVPSVYDQYVSAHNDLEAGSAGGPLLASDGRLLGMAVSALRPTGVHAGVDFDGWPSDCTTLFIQGADIQRSVESIAKEGQVKRPLLGVLLERDTTKVDLVLPASPAESAGLQEGDRIVRLAGASTTSRSDIGRALLRRRFGETVVAEVDRKGKVHTHRLQLAKVEIPPPPASPPLPGCTLALTAVPLTDGQVTLTVSIGAVDPTSELAQTGLVSGDRVVRVDGRGALRFLDRHRYRPSGDLPRVLEVERAGKLLTFSLRD